MNITRRAALQGGTAVALSTAAITAAGCYGRRITIEQRDQYLAVLEQQERRGRERYRELGLEPYLSEIERHRERYWALFHQICETPTKSVEGFAAKVSLLCEDLEESEPQLELVLSVRVDAERLTGEVLS